MVCPAAGCRPHSCLKAERSRLHVHLWFGARIFGCPGGTIWWLGLKGAVAAMADDTGPCWISQRFGVRPRCRTIGISISTCFGGAHHCSPWRRLNRGRVVRMTASAPVMPSPKCCPCGGVFFRKKLPQSHPGCRRRATPPRHPPYVSSVEMLLTNEPARHAIHPFAPHHDLGWLDGPQRVSL